MVFWPLILLGVFASELEIQSSFVDFMSKYRPEGYLGVRELEKRYGIFKENFEFVEETNRSQSDYVLELNEFADLTSDEFFSEIKNRRSSSDHSAKSLSLGTDTKNWATDGAVSPVEKLSGDLTDIIVSVVKSIETNYFMNPESKQTLFPLSYQQLIDCLDPFPTVESAYSYVTLAGGLMAAKDYPRTDTKEDCKFERAKITAPINGAVKISAQDQQALENYVDAGTITVGIDASSSVFQFYKSGIISSNCGKTIDHYVLLVGYGNTTDSNYWIIQNNWGTSWGEEGYARLLKDGSTNSWGECGIAISPYFPYYQPPSH